MVGKFKRLIIACLSVVGLIYILPFALCFEDAHTRSIVFNHVVYYLISRDYVAKSNESTPVALWRLTSSLLRNSEADKKIYDIPSMQILLAKEGFCDQQSLVLINFARAHGLDGRLVFLFGQDSISHHSVAEIKAGSEYGMFDPYYGLIFRDSEGNVLSVEQIKDIADRKDWNLTTLEKKTNYNRVSYKRLFGKKYKQVVKSTNDIGRLNEIWLTLIKLSCNIYGSFFYEYWIDWQCIDQNEWYNLNELGVIK